MAEIAFLKTHVAELSDTEPLAVNFQRRGRFFWDTYCCPTLEIEEVWLGTHEAKLWAMVCCVHEEVVEACKACMVVFSTYSLQEYQKCVWFGQQTVLRLKMTPRRLGVSEEHLKSHCFSVPLHRTSCSLSTARTSSLLLQRVNFAFFHGLFCF